jgi:hypothetical protein
MKRVIPFLLLASMLSLGKAFGASGELIAFIGDPESAVTKDFKEKFLPLIKEMAKSQGITLTEKNISKGAPAEVAFTPSLFFQNHLGRSLYVGRYQLIDKVKTFIRTVSRMPQAPATNEKHDVLVWKRERATVFSPVKITALGGTLPDGHDAEAFHAEALKALAAGATNYTLQALYTAARTDRAMYLAVYPYRGSDGKFFVSAEMYSQFNCIEPIYKRFDKPFEGTWKSWQKVFEEAGKVLQAEVVSQLGSTAKGDGMIPVPTKTPIKSWEDLGFSLPKAPEGASALTPTNVQLGTRWEFAGPVEAGSPMLNFSFMAPLDYYAGEAKTLFGTLEFSAGPNVDQTEGKFGIETQSLTMGDPSLDAHVHELIAILEHPKAFFTFEKMMSVEHPQLAFGALTQFSLRGQLEFMSVKVPLDVTAQMEPVLDENGAARIQVNAAFSLRLKEPFGLDGPDGPQPAKDTMQFLLNFLLKPLA